MRKLVTFSALALVLGACAKKTPSLEPTMHEQATAAASTDVSDAPTPRHPTPPVAKKVPHERTLHGETFVDDYFWLREKDHPEVLAHLAAEEAYADAVMERFKPLTDQLFDEIVSHIAEDDESTPARLGPHAYWRKVEKGKNYPIHLRRPADGGPAELVLDVNALAAGKEFMGIGEFEPSDDGRLLLYSTDETGFRQYTLRVRDLQTGQDLPETFEKVVSSTWAADGKTLFYVVEDHAKRPYRLYRHTLGTPVSQDALVYEETDQRFELHVERSKSARFVIAHAESKLASEVRLIPADTPEVAPTLVLAREGEHEYHVEHHGDWLVIRTNDQGKNFRLVKAPLANPSDRSLWVELRPHDPEVMLERHLVLSSAIAVETRQGGLPHIEVARLSPATELAPSSSAASPWDRIALPDPIYEVEFDPTGNLEFQTKTLRYVYQSLATPKTTFEYDLATKTSTRLKEDPVPGGFDRTRYVTERLFARSHDGVEVPISLVRRADLALDAARPHPLHLVGYGSYGFSYPVTFSPARLTLLDRGVILAIAHVRGGGELGKRWHEDGRLANKMNTFQDFIAAAEHLVATGYTSPSRLSIEGGSAGGLLMGAVVNLRPELFHAVISQVPFVDVVNTMNDPTLPLTVTEYEEWGNPNLPEQYAWIRAYSPYDNLEKKRYPHMLVKTSYNDSQVMYWEPAKYVARLRALKTDDHILIFKINLGAAGHGGKSGRYDRFREVAFDQAFLLWKHGLTD
jgi:oligopeptidase B